MSKWCTSVSSGSGAKLTRRLSFLLGFFFCWTPSLAGEGSAAAGRLRPRGACVEGCDGRLQATAQRHLPSLPPLLGSHPGDPRTCSRALLWRSPAFSMEPAQLLSRVTPCLPSPVSTWVYGRCASKAWGLEQSWQLRHSISRQGRLSSELQKGEVLSRFAQQDHPQVHELVRAFRRGGASKPSDHCSLGSPPHLAGSNSRPRPRVDSNEKDGGVRVSAPAGRAGRARQKPFGPAAATSLHLPTGRNRAAAQLGAAAQAGGGAAEGIGAAGGAGPGGRGDDDLLPPASASCSHAASQHRLMPAHVQPQPPGRDRERFISLPDELPDELQSQAPTIFEVCPWVCLSETLDVSGSMQHRRHSAPALDASASEGGRGAITRP